MTSGRVEKMISWIGLTKTLWTRQSGGGGGHLRGGDAPAHYVSLERRSENIWPATVAKNAWVRALVKHRHQQASTREINKQTGRKPELQLTLSALLHREDCLYTGTAAVYSLVSTTFSRESAAQMLHTHKKRQDSILLQRNPGEVCLPLLRQRCPARWEISCFSYRATPFVCDIPVCCPTPPPRGGSEHPQRFKGRRLPLLVKYWYCHRHWDYTFNTLHGSRFVPHQKKKSLQLKSLIF